jgi:hypothetical protein
MKIRLGYVSNSSSSSFVILLSELSATQLHDIRNHIDIARDRYKEMYCDDYGDKWDIFVNEKDVRGCTYMDNFNMEHFLKEIGVPEEKIIWGT